MDFLFTCVRAGLDNKAAAAVAAFSGDINACDADGHTILMAAIWCRCFQTIAALAARGDCNPNGASSYMETVVHYATRFGCAALAQLLKCFLTLDLDARDAYGWVALHYAAVNGNEANVKLLLDAGADATLKTLGGRTAGEMAQGYHIAHLCFAAAAWRVGTRAAWIAGCVAAVIHL